MRDHWLLKTAQFTLLACYLAGCSGDGGIYGDRMTSVGEAPTGTFLEPVKGPEGSGYIALDETCERTEAADYLDRFRSPMFRDSVAIDDVV